MIKIGNNIKKLRELKNLSRQHIADNVGLSLKTYSNIENDLTSPDLKTLEAIADIIEVSFYKLFNFDEKIILNNHGKHVENFGSHFNQYGLTDNERHLYERIIKEKDAIIKTLESKLK